MWAPRNIPPPFQLLPHRQAQITFQLESPGTALETFSCGLGTLEGVAGAMGDSALLPYFVSTGTLELIKKKSFVDFPIPSPAIFSAPFIAELFQGVIQTCTDPLSYSISSVSITISFPPHYQDRPTACIKLNGYFPLTHHLSGHSWQMSCLFETALDSLAS